MHSRQMVNAVNITQHVLEGYPEWLLTAQTTEPVCIPFRTAMIPYAVLCLTELLLGGVVSRNGCLREGRCGAKRVNRQQPATC